MLWLGQRRLFFFFSPDSVGIFQFIPIRIDVHCGTVEIEGIDLKTSRHVDNQGKLEPFRELNPVGNEESYKHKVCLSSLFPP